MATGGSCDRPHREPLHLLRPDRTGGVWCGSPRGAANATDRSVMYVECAECLRCAILDIARTGARGRLGEATAMLRRLSRINQTSP